MQEALQLYRLSSYLLILLLTEVTGDGLHN